MKEHDVVKTNLDSAKKRVRIVDERNEVLEFQVQDYKSKWEESLLLSNHIQSNLTSLELTLDAVQTMHSGRTCHAIAGVISGKRSNSYFPK